MDGLYQKAFLCLQTTPSPLIYTLFMLKYPDSMLFSALFWQSPHYTLLHDLKNKAADPLHYLSQSSFAIVICHRFFLKTRGRLNLFQTAFSGTINFNSANPHRAASAKLRAFRVNRNAARFCLFSDYCCALRH